MPIVSQCPLCLTAFRVSELQISAAEGLVRCGACGHIFDARLHRLGEPAAEESAEPSAAELNQAYIADLFSESAESVWETETPAGEADLWGEADWETDQAVAAGGGPTPTRFELLETPAGDGADDAMRPIEEVPEGEHPTAENPAEHPRLAADAGADAMAASEGAPGDASTAERSPAEQATATEDRTGAPGATGTADADGTEEAAAMDTVAADSGDAGSETGDAADQQAAPPIAAARIAPLPVEMELVSTARRAAPSLAWSVACAFAALVLAAQYVWFNREEPGLRAFYASTCALFGCSVPLRRDLQLIRLDTLVIKPAAGRTDALEAEAIITNRATFPQRFPALELVFTDMDGHTVASRVFEANEYLEAGADSGRAMGSRESVRVHLVLMDPGEDATNYRVYLWESDPGDPWR